MIAVSFSMLNLTSTLIYCSVLVWTYQVECRTSSWCLNNLLLSEEMIHRNDNNESPKKKKLSFRPILGALRCMKFPICFFKQKWVDTDSI